MELNTNMIGLLTWGSFVRVVAWLVGLFLFWRANKSEIGTDKLFRLINRLFFIGIIVYVLSYIVNIPTGVAIIAFSFLIIKRFNDQNRYDLWLLLDSLAPVLLVFITFDLIVTLVEGFQWLLVIELSCLIVYFLVIFPWSKKNFRILSWYPSGKPGFVVLVFIEFWLAVELVFAYFKGTGLYWQSLVLVVGLIINVYCWQRQSGHSCFLPGRNILKYFKKRRSDVS